MNIIYMAPGDITPYGQNAKKHPEEQVEHIANSIKEFGFRQPLVIDKDGVLIIGHGRLLAAKKLGLETVPVVKADDLTEEQVKALRLADNKTNESEWDLELLDAELAEIFDFDMSEFGFDMEQEEPPEVEEVDVPEEVEARCKLGQIWRLGDHRLICGDSTDPQVIARLMAGETAALYLTDPPYNVSLGQTSGHVMRPSEAKQLHRRTDGKIIENDSWSTEEDFVAFLVRAFEAAMEVMNPGAVFYIWHADSQSFNFRLACREAGMQVRQNIIWNKNIFTFGRQDYQWKHEPCLYGWKDGAAHYFIDDRTQSTVMSDAEEINPKRMKKAELVALVEQMMADRVSTTVINEDKPSRSVEHPTMKPVKLLARLIKNSSRIGDLVLDSFGGSGSTLVTCQQLNRRCNMAELDPHYCDVIIQRWEDFTGQKAELIN